MSKRIKPTGEAYKKLVNEYHKVDHQGKIILAQKWGIQLHTLRDWVSEGDTGQSEMPESQPQVIPYPELNLKKYNPKRSRRTPETQVLTLGDIHTGEQTPTYNSDVFKQRIQNLVKSTLKIAELHRNAYPINHLKVFFLGDIIHGENPHQGAKVEDINLSAFGQIFEIALPSIGEVLIALSQEFQTIDCYGVDGNHGKYDRKAPRRSNWDKMFYAALAQRISNQKNISIKYSNTFYSLVETEGFKFFLFHGNQVVTYQGIPFYGLKRKIMSWHVTTGGFSYAVCGHWHECHNISISSKTELFMNGAFPSDDPFALEVIGTSSVPRQWTFGVHPERGVTWRYPLELEDAKR